MSEESITIKKSDWIRLEIARIKLDALECAGVDNWCGYSEAHEYITEEDKEFLDEN